MIAAICICFPILLMIGTPIAVILGSTTLLCLLLFTNTPLYIITQQFFDALDKFVLLAIPFFILSGAIMSRGSIIKRLIDFVNALIGWFPGGLAIASIFGCIFFAAVSGSSPATVVAIGSIMIPALIKVGYGDRFSLGLLTVSGSLGIMIPPSIPMILYSLVMNISVAEIFMAGIVPGLLMATGLIVYTYLTAKKNNWRIITRVSISKILSTAKEGVWALMLPFIVLGGIYLGVFTPTEAAAVSVIYTLLVELLIYKEFQIKDITNICQEAAILSTCLLFILSTAMTFIWLLTSEEIPQHLADIILHYIRTPWLFLLTVNFLFFVLGCFMDDVSAMLILAPVFLETLQRYQIDLVHFGVIMVLNIQIGMLTPPFGLNLFVTSGITKEPLLKIAQAVFPFLIIMLICLFFVTYIPSISLFLPKWLLR